jgi:hypothetical protein
MKMLKYLSILLFTLSIILTLINCTSSGSNNDGGQTQSVDTPTFTPTDGTYDSDQQVDISCGTSGATIYYTTDGSTPTTSSSIYGLPISVSGHGTTMTIKALAVKGGMIDSTIASAAYIINYQQVSTPNFTPIEGTYDSDQQVDISCGTSGATIYYTTDGSTPTTSSSIYGLPISVSGHGTTMTIKALAVKGGMIDSTIASAAYSIEYQQVDAPEFTPAAGEYMTAQSIVISTMTSGASIRYTTDGSEPTSTTGTIYSGPVDISSTTTLKAIAYKAGWADSQVTTGLFTIAKYTEEVEKFVAYDPADGDWFGFSVDLDGDYVIAGAYAKEAANCRGVAYVFHKTGTDTWDTGTKITAFDAQDYDSFGCSVSLNGDYAIVGAFMEDGAGTDRGVAYIFHRTGTNTWDTGTKITASDAQDDDVFGFGADISGDYAIVGAASEDGAGTNRGAVYIFHRTGTNTWDTGTKITASDAQDDDGFGISVAINGDYAIVGAQSEDGAGTNRGAAYIFHRTGTNTWDSGTKIIAPDAEDNDNFGKSVAINGDYAIVGAEFEDGSGIDRGAAYIFHRTGTNTWDAGTKIIAPDAEDSDWYGNSVAINGDYAIVGAYKEDGAGNMRGAAYIYHRIGDNDWDTGTKISASDTEDLDSFGESVAISTDYAIVGTRWEDGVGGNQRGAAYIYK